MTPDVIQDKINFISEKFDADIIIYSGDIKRPYDDVLINECRTKKSRANVLLVLCTYGGDPDAAYRITRCLQKAYFTKDNKQNENKTGKLIVYVDGVCKSAGTLICLGANEIIMSGNGELGPLDTQLNEKHEVGAMTSGLTPIQSVDFLIKRAIYSFNEHFVKLRFDKLRFSTKLAAEVATQLTIGLLTPLSSQIDPIRLAEVERSLRIAEMYGERLMSNNIREGALEYLIGSYPSHGFVIDRIEASQLFKMVCPPCPELREIGQYYLRFVGNDDPCVIFTSSENLSSSYDEEEKMISREKAEQIL